MHSHELVVIEAFGRPSESRSKNRNLGCLFHCLFQHSIILRMITTMLSCCTICLSIRNTLFRFIPHTFCILLSYINYSDDYRWNQNFDIATDWQSCHLYFYCNFCHHNKVAWLLRLMAHGQNVRANDKSALKLIYSTLQEQTDKQYVRLFPNGERGNSFKLIWKMVL